MHQRCPVCVSDSVDAETRQHTGPPTVTISRSICMFDGDGVSGGQPPKQRNRTDVMIPIRIIQIQVASALQCPRCAAMFQSPAKQIGPVVLCSSHREAVHSRQCRCELLPGCTPTAIVVVDTQELWPPTE